MGKLFMIKQWFKKENLRHLESPTDLKVNDMFDLVDSMGLPSELRNKTFRVAEINTYEYQHDNITEFLIEGPSMDAFHMTVENEDGEYWINFTKKIERQEVETIFDMDSFSQLFDDEVSLDTLKVLDTSGFERWLSNRYRLKHQWQKGYFHKGDYREKSFSQYEEDEQSGEAFEVLSLASDDDMFSIDIEVWQDGQTDVFLCITRPQADIDNLYNKQE